MKISQADRQSILETALQAPTADNSQPWIFEWISDSLNITHDASRAQHPLNPKNSASALMLGCLLETIEIAALDVGLKIRIDLKDLSAEGNALWACVDFVLTDLAADPLSKFIRVRSTDRRKFNKGELSAGLFNEIKLNESKYAPARLHVVSNIHSDLQNYIVDAEQNLMDHSDILPAVMKWTRFTMSEARRTGDGISWRNMLAKVWELPVMYLVPKFPAFLNLVRPQMVKQHRARTLQQLNSSAGLICISSKKTSTHFEGAVQAGRLMMRVWLRLTQLGYGVQPVSLATLPIFYQRENLMDSFFSKQADFFKQGETTLRNSFAIAEENFPIWMIRTGISTPLPAEMRTFRKPLKPLS